MAFDFGVCFNLRLRQAREGREIFMASCRQLNLLETTIQQGSPSIAPLLDLLNAPDWSKINSSYCPVALPSATRRATTGQGSAG